MAFTIERRDKLWVGQFRCMASPCELLVETRDESLAGELIALAQEEAMRIEQKFSRYRDDNIVYRINTSADSVNVDAETARLLDFAQTCYHISDGLFDITSGVLRQAWNFSAGSDIPQQQQVEALLPLIGWHKISWRNQQLQVPLGMEIDFGGIGKEFAVDSVHSLISQQTDSSFLVNFGGDCHASGPQEDGSSWITGIENPRKPGDASAIIRLRQGALATSGDVYKFVRHDGVRYGHILNPKTGWPATDSPMSVTVAAPTCTEAGIMSTLAMLHGSQAENFLDSQNVKYWCCR